MSIATWPFGSQPPTGPGLVELRAGRYRAAVSVVGAALARLEHDGRPLVLDTTEAVLTGTLPMPPYSGVVLAPWPNRVRDGRYRFAGEPQQLPITEVERGCALHGLLAWTAWSVADAGDSSLRLAATIHPQPGYPFTVDVAAEYALSPAGLRVTLGARNRSAGTVPFGTSLHPYLVPGVHDGVLDDWTLTLPMTTVVDVDPERLLPRALVPAQSLGLDFRTPRRLAGVALDHAFGGATGDTAVLTGPDGFGVHVSWDERCPWLQVCTIDAAPQPWVRRGLAVEPMTCPPDAFNSGTDLWLLGPGEGRDCAMTIAAAP